MSKKTIYISFFIGILTCCMFLLIKNILIYHLITFHMPEFEITVIDKKTKKVIKDGFMDVSWTSFQTSNWKLFKPRNGIYYIPQKNITRFFIFPVTQGMGVDFAYGFFHPEYLHECGGVSGTKYPLKNEYIYLKSHEQIDVIENKKIKLIFEATPLEDNLGNLDLIPKINFEYLYYSKTIGLKYDIKEIKQNWYKIVEKKIIDKYEREKWYEFIDEKSKYWDEFKK